MTDVEKNNIIKLAQKKCKEWHDGQYRKYTNEPYHVHPFEVASILTKAQQSQEVVIAGYLHDVLEDCDVSEDEIERLFGERVKDLVLMVTDISRPEDGNRKTRKNIDKEHLALADKDGQTVKLADLISNSKSICEYDPGFAKVYMREKKELLTVLTKGHTELYEQALDIILNFKNF